MIEQLVALAKIAGIDAEALRADTELRDIPLRMEALHGDVKKLGELLAAERQQLADADRLLSAQEDELDNQSKPWRAQRPRARVSATRARRTRSIASSRRFGAR